MNAAGGAGVWTWKKGRRSPQVRRGPALRGLCGVVWGCVGRNACGSAGKQELHLVARGLDGSDARTITSEALPAAAADDHDPDLQQYRPNALRACAGVRTQAIARAHRPRSRLLSDVHRARKVAAPGARPGRAGVKGFFRACYGLWHARESDEPTGPGGATRRFDTPSRWSRARATATCTTSAFFSCPLITVGAS